MGSRNGRRPLIGWARQLNDQEAGDPRTGDDESDEATDDKPMDPYAGIVEHQREQRIVAAVETLEEIQRVQSQTRNRHGKLRRAKFIGAVLGLRYEGFTPKQIAETLGCSHQQVTRALTQVRKDANLDAQVKRLNDLAVPLAMDNAIRGVIEGDKEYTLRVLDGAGIFRTHQTVKGEIKQTIQQLSVVLEIPAHLQGKELPMPKPGSIVGAPTLATGLPPAQALEGIVIVEEKKPEPLKVPDGVNMPLYQEREVQD